MSFWDSVKKIGQDVESVAGRVADAAGKVQGAIHGAETGASGTTVDINQPTTVPGGSSSMLLVVGAALVVFLLLKKR